MTQGRVDQVNLPDALRNHDARLRALEATPAGGGITEIDSSTLDITNPTGPVVDIELPNNSESVAASPLSVASNSQGDASLFHDSGATLLDYTTPTAPTFINSGIYIINASVGVPGAPVPALVEFARVLLNNTLISYAVATLVLEGGALGGPAACSLCYGAFFGSGAKVGVEVANDGSTSWTFTTTLKILKIGD